MCPKYLEAWNKNLLWNKFCASSWLNTEIKKDNKCLFNLWFVVLWTCPLSCIRNRMLHFGKVLWSWKGGLRERNLDIFLLSGNIADLLLGGADFRSWLGHQYILTETFHGFPQSLQASTGILPESRSWPLPSASFLIAHSSSYHWMLWHVLLTWTNKWQMLFRIKILPHNVFGVLNMK